MHRTECIPGFHQPDEQKCLSSFFSFPPWIANEGFSSPTGKIGGLLHSHARTHGGNNNLLPIAYMRPEIANFHERSNAAESHAISERAVCALCTVLYFVRYCGLIKRLIDKRQHTGAEYLAARCKIALQIRDEGAKKKDLVVVEHAGEK